MPLDAARVNLSPPAATLEDWMEQGRCLKDEWLHLRQLTTELMFRIGDWWNEGESRWPHESSQMMDEYSYWQITKFASIAGRVPPENRLTHDIPDMTIEHYRVVARLSPPEQAEALQLAQQEGYSAGALRRALEGDTAVPETHACPECGAEHRRKA